MPGAVAAISATLLTAGGHAQAASALYRAEAVRDTFTRGGIKLFMAFDARHPPTGSPGPVLYVPVRGDLLHPSLSLYVFASVTGADNFRRQLTATHACASSAKSLCVVYRRGNVLALVQGPKRLASFSVLVGRLVHDLR